MMRPAPDDRAALRREVARPLRLAAVVAVGFFVAGGGWAASAPLRSAVIAPGVVAAEQGRRTVQHLEGGILGAIAVREGEVVTAGQVLVTLDDVAARGRVAALTARLRSLAATEARLAAERGGAAEIAFDHPALADTSDPAVASLRAAEARHLRALREDMANREAILTQRLAQTERRIEGHAAQRAALERQRSLVAEEAAGVRSLVDQGLSARPRLLALERERARLEGQVGELTAAIALAEEELGETRLRILTLRSDRLPDIDAELARVRADRIATEEALAEAADRLRRATVVAPLHGTVLDLRFTTPGGVVAPGEALMDLVPSDEPLVIDARVRPRDIDPVAPGQAVAVTFPALPARHQTRLDGTVTRVSADALDGGPGEGPYFAVRVVVDAASLADSLAGHALHPGLPAEVAIATGERTLLGILADPLTRTLARGLREE